MIYVLCGTEQYLLKKELDKLLLSFGEEWDSVALNTSIFKGEDITLEELIRECNTLPFIGRKRFIIVYDFITEKFAPKSNIKLAENKRNDNKAKIDNFFSLLINIPESSVLIFIEQFINKDISLLNRLADAGCKIKKIDSLSNLELKEWIRTKVSSYGAKIDDEAVKTLMLLAGEDLWKLENEIQKLSLYENNKVINRDTVMNVSSFTREINIFNVIDDLFNKDHISAHVLAKRLLKEGVSLSQILGIILRQMRAVIKIKILNNIEPRELMRELNISSEYVIKKIGKQANKFDLNQIIRLYDVLLEADMNAKTSNYDDETIIEMMIYEFCKGNI